MPMLMCSMRYNSNDELCYIVIGSCLYFLYVKSNMRYSRTSEDITKYKRSSNDEGVSNVKVNYNCFIYKGIL